MLAKLPLEAITLVLKDLKGYFTFSTVHGEYVVVRKEDFTQLQAAAAEKQMELPPVELGLPTDQVVLPTDDENIPGDITDQEVGEFGHGAESAGTELEVAQGDLISGGYDDLAIDSEPESAPGKKVSFEPLRGDLSPELQD